MDSKIEPHLMFRLLKGRRYPLTWLAGYDLRLERRSRNLAIFRQLRRLGADYLMNPGTYEIHEVSFGIIGGSHNLLDAHLDNFFPIWDMGLRRISSMNNGSIIPVLDLFTGDKLTTFMLNKCAHCFPIFEKPFAQAAAVHAN